MGCPKYLLFNKLTVEQHLIKTYLYFISLDFSDQNNRE